MKTIYLFLFLGTTTLSLSQPANDNCNSAETITIGSSLTTINFDLSNAALNNEPGCDGTVTSYADVWYSFTMPFDGNVVIDGSISWNNIGATNACSGNLLACDSAELVLTNISANTNVLLRIFRTLSLADDPQFSSFTIQAFETPSNDKCINSINVPLGILEEDVSFDIGGCLPDSESGCSSDSGQYVDVWYDFTMPFDCNLFLDGGNTTINNFEVFDTCSGESLFCGEGDLLALGLTGGSNYKVRVYRSIEDSFTTAFLEFSAIAFRLNENDNCTTAIPLNLSEELTTITTPFLGGSIIESATGCTSDVMDYLDIWYTFTLAEQGDVNIESGTIWNQFELYDACDGIGLQCFSQNGTFSNLSAGTYYLRLFRELEFATSPAFKNFDISSTAETLSTSILELESTKIFPNPVTDYISVTSPLDIHRAEIFDLTGKRLLTTHSIENIKVKFLQKGIYIIRLFSDSGFTNKSFIKK
jgi:hypothetical protein